METKLCEYGCGKEARHQLKNGKWCCEALHFKCDGYRNSVSERLEREYKNGTRKKVLTKKSWNRGQTKENNPKLAEISKRLREEFSSGKRKSKLLGTHISEERKRNLSKCGGVKCGAGRGKNGWYKGYWCDSSWELAYVIYNLEHRIKFERNHEGFEYEFEGKKHKYYPDFILEDGTYVEIKGFMDSKSKSKIEQFAKPLLVLDRNKIFPILKEIIDKHGTGFISLYDGYIPSKTLNGFKEEHQNKLWFRKPKPLKLGKCPRCGKERPINYKRLCRQCFEELKRKGWQTKEVLEIEIKNSSWEELGRKYGISGNAIKKRARAYGIEIPSRKSREKFFCKCGKEIKKGNQTCKDCYIPLRKVKRPSMKELLAEKEKMSYRELGEKYNISGPSIRRWIKEFKRESD